VGGAGGTFGLVFGEGGGVGVGISGGGFGDVGGGVCCVQPTEDALRAMAARIYRLAFMVFHSSL